jgi:hypothetical protein
LGVIKGIARGKKTPQGLFPGFHKLEVLCLGCLLMGILSRDFLDLGILQIIFPVVFGPGHCQIHNMNIR